MKVAGVVRGLINRFSISLMLTLFVLPVACSSTNDRSPTSTSSNTLVTTTAQSEPVDAPGASTAEPTSIPWLEALKIPGNGNSLPDQFFFSNGPDLWLAASDGTAREILREMRVGPHADVPDGSRTAVVFTISVGLRAAEEIRFVDPDGSISDPIYGPVFLDGPGSKPPIRALAWTRDGERLALIRHDGSVSGLQVAGASPALDSYPLFESDILPEISSFIWSPNGDGAVLLGSDEARIGRLRALPGDGSEGVEVAPDGTSSRSIGAVDWIPEQGRLIVAEDDGARINPNAGTLFSLNPDGTGRELLISSGEFGPAVAVPILSTSPAGDWAAFTVYVPGANGTETFSSLWIFEFASSVLIPIPVSEGFRVTDVWWTSRGLAWRGVDISAPAGQKASKYEGFEPFTVAIYDIESGQTSRIMNSNGY